MLAGKARFHPREPLIMLLVASVKNLWRHAKTCAVRREYHAAHSEVDSVRSKRIASVKLMNNVVFTDSDQCLIDLISRMRDDDMSE